MFDEVGILRTAIALFLGMLASADGRPANAAFFCNGNEIAETAEVHSCHTEIVWVVCAMVLDLKSM